MRVAASPYNWTICCCCSITLGRALRRCAIAHSLSRAGSSLSRNGSLSLSLSLLPPLYSDILSFIGATGIRCAARGVYIHALLIVCLQRWLRCYQPGWELPWDDSMWKFNQNILKLWNCSLDLHWTSKGSRIMYKMDGFQRRSKYLRSSVEFLTSWPITETRTSCSKKKVASAEMKIYVQAVLMPVFKSKVEIGLNSRTFSSLFPPRTNFDTNKLQSETTIRYITSSLKSTVWFIFSVIHYSVYFIRDRTEARF